MNKETIIDWLKDIATPTGISYSGDQTITDSMFEKIIEYIGELEKENQQLQKKLQRVRKQNQLKDNACSNYKYKITFGR